MTLLSVRTAPLATVVPLAEVPRALFVFTCNVPALIVVLPVNVFEPLNVTLPLVFFVTVLLPARITLTVPLCSV